MSHTRVHITHKHDCSNIQGGCEELIKPPVTKSDMGTQIDTHFMESNIVKSYEWKEWELRRKAIKLVCVGGWVALGLL